MCFLAAILCETFWFMKKKSHPTGSLKKGNFLFLLPCKKTSFYTMKHMHVSWIGYGIHNFCRKWVLLEISCQCWPKNCIKHEKHKNFSCFCEFSPNQLLKFDCCIVEGIQIQQIFVSKIIWFRIWISTPFFSRFFPTKKKNIL